MPLHKPLHNKFCDIIQKWEKHIEISQDGE